MDAMTKGKLMSVKRGVGVMAAGVLLVALAMPAPASAEGPWWRLSASARPTYLPPAGEGEIVVAASNFGDAEANGGVFPITIADKLPAGMTPIAIASRAGTLGGLGELECAPLPALSCHFTGALQPYERLEVEITVDVPASAASGAENEVTVSGGGLPSTTTRQSLTVDGGAVPFGVENYELTPENDGGAPDTQAGSHPFQLTSELSLNTGLESGQITLAALPKDLSFNLPPGLTGDPSAVPQCTDLQFSTIVVFANQCPTASVLGVALVTILEPSLYGPRPLVIPVPVFNLVPHRREPARFGFEALSVPVILDTALRTGKDYGVVVSASDIPESAELLGSQVTFWGVPDDPRHNSARGWHCVAGGFWNSLIGGSCTSPEHAEPTPFLTLPTSCAEQLKTSVEVDSWKRPDAPGSFPTSEPLRGLDGCDRLGFEPSINVAPDVQAASTPTGVTVGVHVPQEISLNPAGLAEADVKDTTVALPAGVQLSPSAGDGLQACSDAQIGFTGVNPQTGTDEFTSNAPTCPEASKVATVKIKTPLLPNALEGAVYLAAPQNFAGPPLENPFGSLVAMYIVAEDPVSGVLVKLSGRVTPDPVTGQLVSTFQNTPQLPFEDLQLKFFGGARAPLSTPPYCGTYTTTASFAPWSGNAPVTPLSSFEIKSGPNGSSCANPLPFAPSLAGGSTHTMAGAFTPFTLTMSREDGNQNLAGLTLHMPPGLLGVLSSVTPCPEPQAAQGACGPESLIGHTVASVGLGSDPFTVPGTVFITGPYKGAPYGLSIVTPAIAGPFNLGTVVVRAKIEVDPRTSALTITSDPLPTILRGIPLQLKHVNVTVDRPGFTFNPTNCSPLAITATLSSQQGATAPATVPFQAANCASLPFQPQFTALAQAKTSKAGGAYLHVKVVSGAGQANIAKVKVDLPVQLPSRLSTLQKACVAAVFEANPASCPAASVVGTATAVTPVLKSVLTGPAYLVSHGGAKFPDLEIVLQGEGITLILVGNTDIKKGITSSTFKAVPDAPVSTFDLVLPVGPHSVLAAYLPVKAKGSMCGQSLAMPTAITGQNGAVVKQTTKIAVSGCPKHKKVRKQAKKVGAKHTRGAKKKG
jgi:hypothetical protein